jgi:hypothetical protein
MDGYEKIVRSLTFDMTDEERERLHASIRETDNPEHPFWAVSLMQEKVTAES